MLLQPARPVRSRGGSKSKKLESELADTFFPLHLMSGVTNKNLSFLPLIFHPPLAPYIIQRKFEKIQRKILNISILRFWAAKPIHKLLDCVSLHSLGPYPSFDNHIDISMKEICRMAYASNMAFLTFSAEMTLMSSNIFPV